MCKWEIHCAGLVTETLDTAERNISEFEDKWLKIKHRKQRQEKKSENSGVSDLGVNTK